MGNSPKRPLNDRQLKFINEYLKDRSPAKAAIRAGYKPKNADVTASDLLNHPRVRAEIDKFIRIEREKTGVSVERILNNLKRIAEADLRQAFHADGTLKPIHEIPSDVALAMSSIESDDILMPNGRKVGVTRKIKFWDKTKALELLGKHIAMFTDNVRHSSDEALIELLGLVTLAIKQRVPNMCPNCRTELKIRGALAKEFSDYGTRLAIGNNGGARLLDPAA